MASFTAVRACVTRISGRPAIPPFQEGESVLRPSLGELFVTPFAHGQAD